MLHSEEMDKEDRRQIDCLINEWYRQIVDGKPGAAVAARKLTLLASAGPDDFARVALRALREAGLQPVEATRERADSSPDVRDRPRLIH